MRRHFQQPLALDLDDVPHELLGREHQLEVDHPSGKVFKHAAVRMNGHGLKCDLKNLESIVHYSLLE